MLLNLLQSFGQIYFSEPAQLQNQLLTLKISLFLEILRSSRKYTNKMTEIYVNFAKYVPLTKFPPPQIIFIISQMLQRVFLIILLLALHIHAQPPPIALDFNGFEASFSSDQKLKLVFRCTGGSGLYNFQFKNVPTEWKILGNTIVIQKFSTNVRQNWRFSIYVTDTQNNFFSQNLMLNFMGAYVGLTSVTLPVTGQIAGSYNNNFYNPFSIANQISQPVANSQPFQQPVAIGSASQQPKVTDLVTQYPGMDPVDRLTSGFGITNDSPLTADIIASAKAVYNPSRDINSASSPYSGQKDTASRRLSAANQTIDGLNELINKLLATIAKLKEESRAAETDANNSRAVVSQCDSQVLKLQDTKTKILNGIKDKESMLAQYNAQVAKQDRAIELQVIKLNSLEDLRKKTEADTLPNSRTLQNLQRTLDQCRSSLVKNSKDSQQNRLEIQKTQTQIKMLTMETNQAKVKIDKLNSQLSTIREKIISLDSQMKEAKQYEANILSDKAKYELIPINNDRKVAVLQQKLNTIKASSPTVKNAEDCKIYEGPITTVQNILSKDRDRYNQVINQVEAQKKIVQKAKTNSADLKKTINSLPMEINALKKQVSTYEASIDRANYLCDDKINEYSKFAVSFQSINQKIDSSSAELARLNGQLTFAQGEQTAAANALSEIIKAESAYFNNRATSTPNPNPVTPSAPSQPRVNPPQQASASATAPPLQYQIPTSSSSSFNSGSSFSSAGSTLINPNISIDQIINIATKQRAAAQAAAVSQGSTVSSPQNTPQIQPTQPQYQVQTQPQPQPQPQYQIQPQTQPSLPQILTPASSQASRPQATTPAPTSSNVNTESDFSIASFLANSVDQLSAPTTSTSPNPQASTPTLTTPNPNNQNPLAENFDTLIGQQFKVSSKASFKSVYIFDARTFLKKVNINIGTNPIAQNLYLYSLDDASKRSLLTSGNAQARLPLLACSTPSLTDTAVIQDIGLGYILAMNGNTLFRLSFSECTKIVSTYTSGSLRQGTRIYFTGVPVVTLPNNVLLNANLVVCNPDPATL